MEHSTVRFSWRWCLTTNVCLRSLYLQSACWLPSSSHSEPACSNTCHFGMQALKHTCHQPLIHNPAAASWMSHMGSLRHNKHPAYFPPLPLCAIGTSGSIANAIRSALYFQALRRAAFKRSSKISPAPSKPAIKSFTERVTIGLRLVILRPSLQTLNRA